jgi:Rhodopirellula transposase DDE domain
MADIVECYESLLQQGAKRLQGHQRRLFMAEVTVKLCAGNPRQAERRFGWGRETIDKGLHELQHDIRCLENFSARGRPRLEEKTPQLAQDIRAILEPHTQADPEVKTARRYSNLSAADVLEALQRKKGYAKDKLPSQRTMRNILNRMNYRLKRIRKGKPLKKTPQTNAIFANVKAIKAEVKGADTLEISVDTKAKVNEGDYARGGEKPDRRGRQGRAGLGS